MTYDSTQRIALCPPFDNTSAPWTLSVWENVLNHVHEAFPTLPLAGTPLVLPPAPATGATNAAGLPAAAVWTAHCAQHLTQELGSSTHVVLGLRGPAAEHAPRLALAQRASRRTIDAYLLIDPLLSPRVDAGAASSGAFGSTQSENTWLGETAAEWPDAPVVIVMTPQATPASRAALPTARLRGWHVCEVPALE